MGSHEGHLVAKLFSFKGKQGSNETCGAWGSLGLLGVGLVGLGSKGTLGPLSLRLRVISF